MNEKAPIIFLVGPPGSGKSTLGAKACRESGLRFTDLSTPEINDQSFESQQKILVEVIAKRSADVIALPWLLQQDKGARKALRRAGLLLLLWAHPLAMQARSGHSESLFTPAPRIKIKGGFGIHGTGCREFRRLDSFSDSVLKLVNTPFGEAVRELRDYIEYLREKSSRPPMARAGVSHWVNELRIDEDISAKTTEIIVDAMARYLLRLRAEGKSARTLSGVYADLYSAAMLVMMYDYPTGEDVSDVLDFFDFPPWTFEYERKFTDAPSAIARYERNLEGFARFLQEESSCRDR